MIILLEINRLMEIDPLYAVIPMEDSVFLAKGIKVGLKIGMSNADFHGEDAKEMEQVMGLDMESKWGLCAGGFVRFNISKAFSI